MKQLPILIILSLCMTGCAVIGNKVVFSANSESQWTYVQSSINPHYFYRCEDLRVNFHEIIVTSDTSSYGFIVPVIPSDRALDFTEQNLIIHIEIIGKISITDAIGNDQAAKFISTDLEAELLGVKLTKISEHIFDSEDQLWVQYSLKYQYAKPLDEINKLSVSFVQPLAGCNIPTINMVKNRVNDNEFIISPGT